MSAPKNTEARIIARLRRINDKMNGTVKSSDAFRDMSAESFQRCNKRHYQLLTMSARAQAGKEAS